MGPLGWDEPAHMRDETVSRGDVARCLGGRSLLVLLLSPDTPSCRYSWSLCTEKGWDGGHLRVLKKQGWEEGNSSQMEALAV